MTAEKSAPELVRSLYLLWGHHPQPGRSGITVTQIVQAGIDLADTDGLGATSMRKVAERLGVSTMALYNHVPRKDDLTALMVDTAYANLYDSVDTAKDAGDWRAGLRYVAERNWMLCTRHPWLLDIHESRMLLGPNATRKYEAELRVLDGIGLSDLDMEASLTTVLGVVESAARAQRSDRDQQRDSGLADPEWWAVIAPALEHLMSDDDYPVSGRVGNTLGATFDAARNPRHALDLGVTFVLDGIENLIHASTGSTQQRTPSSLRT
ncbi:MULTISPECIES: TetR/AcrR family transcriptional regulator [unclassified Microbacterium]|uniref:TetR/AcrR family transcriptional regulator n=1 Tax=unclassified Microbacterium TaxID=2609290 RepID=UPI000EAA5F75|nr:MULTISPECIES: TetR/AcrR family transcriptional regulator [unclassified Microbacterium]MBT2483108.1 TetR/AcrR family transcriptional regulator C-terminal domain-containing protein [Microbacterium sp. ISL-108]RKN66169.1 TetR/AcrR family transcriptional regulator [Microbacterium sp. CGR2]